LGIISLKNGKATIGKRRKRGSISHFLLTGRKMRSLILGGSRKKANGGILLGNQKDQQQQLLVGKRRERDNNQIRPLRKAERGTVERKKGKNRIPR